MDAFRQPAALAARLSLTLLAAWLVACTQQPGPPSPPALLIASDRVMHVDLPGGRIVRQRLLPAPATDLALAPAGDHLAVATRRGAAFLAVPSLDVVWKGDLGIVDAVELSPDGGRAYLLLHPGDDPVETTGDHVVREIAFPSGAAGREARLDSRSYDLFAEHTTGAIYVTDLVGRTVHRIDPTTFTVTDHTIGLGRSPEEEPRGAFLRLVLPGPRPGELVAVEDRRDEARLWHWQPAASRLDLHPLPGIRPPVLGGGALPAGHDDSGGPHGGSLWLHTRSHFLRLDANFNVTRQLDLAGADSLTNYRFSAADRSTCVLLAPARPVLGRAQTRVVWIDLERGMIAGERLLEVAAGPFVLLPRPQPAAAGAAVVRAGG